MKNDLISVIIPIYKVEEYLRQCIESVIGQTYKNLEIILVDDGSPDNCGKICDEYAERDKRIKVIHKENGGLSSARNAGLDIATGEYISFIDSDDYVANNFIETLYTLSIENKADVVECDFVRFEEEVELFNDVKKEIVRYSSTEMQKRIYSDLCIRTVVVWNKLYKKCIYDKLRFPVGKINEDEFTTYKAFDKTSKKIVTTNEALYYYRYNENSIMGKKFNEKRLDVLDAYEERKEYFKSRKNDLLYEITVEKYQNLLKKCYILTKESIENPNKYLKNIKNILKENNKEYQKLTKIKYEKKIRMNLFIYFTELYLGLIHIKNFIKDNQVREFFYKCKVKDYIKFCKKHKQKEFYIFNTPLHGNLGDHAIIYAEKEFLKKQGIKFFEVPTYLADRYFKYIKKYISLNAIVAITGGGFIGSQWTIEQDLVNKVLSDFWKYKIVIFPQTFYFSDDLKGKKELSKSIKVFDRVNDLTIFAREQTTYNFVKENYKKARVFLVPDIVLSLKMYKYKYNRKGILLCFRKDVEASISIEAKTQILKEIQNYEQEIKVTDTVLNYNIPIIRRKYEIKKKLKEFSKAQIVVTDRLHGMILCALTGTPCIILDNISHKVSGVYEKWLKNLDYIVLIEDETKLRDAFEVLKNINNCKFEIDKNFYKDLKKYFFNK